MAINQPDRSIHLLEAENKLQALGFTDYEARIYLALLKSNPATAYELSKRASVPRSNTYGTLESLTRKAVVQPVSQQPTRYVPIEPSLVFGRIARDTSERCKELAEHLEEVQQETGSDFVWTIAGEKHVHAKISEMMREATEHLWIKASEHMLVRHIDEVQGAARRGVRVLIVLFGTDPERFQGQDGVKVFLHEGNGMGIGYGDDMFTLTMDFAAALVARLYGDVHGAYTQSRPIVTMADTFIRHDVYLAHIMGRFRPQIEEAFGRYLLDLRREYLSPAEFARTCEKLAAADPEALKSLGEAAGAPDRRRAPRRRPPER